MLHFSVLERAAFNAQVILSLVLRPLKKPQRIYKKTPKSGLWEQPFFPMVNEELEASYFRMWIYDLVTSSRLYFTNPSHAAQLAAPGAEQTRCVHPSELTTGWAVPTAKYPQSAVYRTLCVFSAGSASRGEVYSLGMGGGRGCRRRLRARGRGAGLAGAITGFGDAWIATKSAPNIFRSKSQGCAGVTRPPVSLTPGFLGLPFQKNGSSGRRTTGLYGR